MSGENINILIIGIGINVNASKDDFPDNLKSKSTSIYIESNQGNRIEIVLANILNKFEHRMNTKEDFDSQIIEWNRNCAHLNQEISFKYYNKIINGIFKGLTPEGCAILSIDGNEKIYNSGEII
jgi:BirA family biotin operon repressor/biotin-[acetyl-CoA-carboxylase] ligase